MEDARWSPGPIEHPGWRPESHEQPWAQEDSVTYYVTLSIGPDFFADMIPNLPPQLVLPAELSVALLDAAIDTMKATARLVTDRKRPRRGRTLKPGIDTPLWNELSKCVRVRLKKYGEKARLGRLLGLPRQRVHELLMSRRHLPDAERTLLLLVWLHTHQTGRSLT